MEEPFIQRETGHYHPKNALAMAYASQLAYPGGLDLNPDYKNEDHFKVDMENKQRQAGEWGFDSFAYSYSEEKKILALIMGNAEDIIIVFRGSVCNNFSNWITDIQMQPVPCGSFGKVHKGFRDALQSVWVGIRGHIPYTEKRNLRLTGHSLGGALALLAGTRFVTEYKENLVKEIYTFGQPRVGDKDFKRAVNDSYLNGRIYKFANCNDTITAAPPFIKGIMEYVDVAHIGYFNKEGLLEFKKELVDFTTAMNFLTGYFRQKPLWEQAPKKGVKNWRSFRRVFKRTFRQDQEPATASTREEIDWQRFKHFFTKELRRLPRRQRPQKTQQMVIELFVQLYLKINPYGVHTHTITTYIDHLKKNIDTNPL